MSRSSNPYEAFTKPFENFNRLPVMPDFTVLPTWGTAAMQLAQTGMTMAVASQQVIATRVAMMATHPGEARTNRESQRMVTEKVEAMQESAAQLYKLSGTLMTAWPKLWTDPKAADRLLKQTISGTERAMKPFSRRATSNAKRLSR